MSDIFTVEGLETITCIANASADVSLGEQYVSHQSGTTEKVHSYNALLLFVCKKLNLTL